jgi:dihydroneopterin aldolase
MVLNRQKILVDQSLGYLQSNKLTRTEYSQTYPYTGQITATKEYIETNDTRQLLNEQINTYRDKIASAFDIDFSVAVFISGGVLSTDGVVSSNG